MEYCGLSVHTFTEVCFGLSVHVFLYSGVCSPFIGVSMVMQNETNRFVYSIAGLV